MNTNQKGFASIVLIIALVVILAGGVGYFELTKKTDTSTSPTQSQTTEQKVKGDQKVASIQIVSLVSKNKTSLPVLTYRIENSPYENGLLEIVSKDSGSLPIGEEILLSGTRTFDFNSADNHGNPVQVPEGDYFLRIIYEDKSGPVRPPVVIAESAVFYVALGANVQAVVDTIPLETTFTGAIQTVRDARPVDGSLEIKVSNKWIEIAVSGQLAAGAIGSVTGLTIDYSAPTQSSVGKKVEVFARKSNSQDPSHFTIVGNEKYYVKVIP